MSHVTHVILHCSILEEDTDWLERLNAWSTEQGYGAFVLTSDVDHATGGTKVFTEQVALAAINYLVIERLVAFLAAIPWREREAAQLFVKDEDDLVFAEKWRG